MASHSVKVTAADLQVGIKNVEFVVMQDGEKFGRLEVSQGAIVWRPARKLKGFRLKWSQLDEMARTRGRRGQYPI